MQVCVVDAFADSKIKKKVQTSASSWKKNKYCTMPMGHPFSLFLPYIPWSIATCAEEAKHVFQWSGWRGFVQRGVCCAPQRRPESCAQRHDYWVEGGTPNHVLKGMIIEWKEGRLIMCSKAWLLSGRRDMGGLCRCVYGVRCMVKLMIIEW